MLLTIQSAHSPQYASQNEDFILLTVKFAEFNEELPFGANPLDVEPHGVELFNRAKAGEFGPVAPYVAPVAEDQPTVSGAQNL